MAVVSCHSRPEFSDAIRNTWLPLVPKAADIRFFLGRGGSIEPKPDEVFLNCDDSYEGLPNKVQEIVRWAHGHGYDFVLKCDDDVVIKPAQLLTSGFDQYDFTGAPDPACRPGEIRTPWGFCYWLSRTAMNMVMDAPLPGQPGSTHAYIHNNDEAWVSTVLYKNEIHLHEDARYYLHRGRKPLAARHVTRPLRRPQVPEQTYSKESFAFCIYMNWEGWHQTPVAVQINEFRRIFSESL